MRDAAGTGARAVVAPAVTRERFVEALSAAVNGVSIVTTGGGAGRAGITVSSFTSVTADPPTVLVCIHRASAACAAISRNRIFCVNLLESGQSHVADVFAGRGARGAFDSKFDCAGWDALVSGAPAMLDALVVIDCRVEACHTVGSHEVFFGLVVGTRSRAGQPLLYSRRAYGQPVLPGAAEV